MLFRPVTMMQPDYEKIVEVSLGSNGFENAKSLARRIIELYEICSNLLSPQQHYDFGNLLMDSKIFTEFLSKHYQLECILGLRNIEIVLQHCAKRISTELSCKTDEDIVYQSLFDINMPKLIEKDEPLFKSIVDSMFPRSALEEKNYDFLRETFECKCKEKDYQAIASLFDKLIEVYELLISRHGLILVGNPYTGKSFVLRVLVDSMAKKHNLCTDDLSKLIILIFSNKFVLITIL